VKLKRSGKSRERRNPQIRIANGWPREKRTASRRKESDLILKVKAGHFPHFQDYSQRSPVHTAITSEWTQRCWSKAKGNRVSKSNRHKSLQGFPLGLFLCPEKGGESMYLKLCVRGAGNSWESSLPKRRAYQDFLSPTGSAASARQTAGRVRPGLQRYHENPNKSLKGARTMRTSTSLSRSLAM